MADLVNPFTGEEVSKDSMSSLVVGIDMFVIVCTVIFIQILEYSQKQFVHKYKDQTIEMTDFTVIVKNLPHDHKF